jgi:excisionase family DNA binding protein
MDPKESLLVSDREAAQLLGIGRTKLRELLAAEAIPSVRIGRRRLVPRAAVEAFVKDLEGAAPA